MKTAFISTVHSPAQLLPLPSLSLLCTPSLARPNAEAFTFPISHLLLLRFPCSAQCCVLEESSAERNRDALLSLPARPSVVWFYFPTGDTTIKSSHRSVPNTLMFTYVNIFIPLDRVSICSSCVRHMFNSSGGILIEIIPSICCAPCYIKHSGSNVMLTVCDEVILSVLT